MYTILSLLHYLEGLHALMNYSLQKLPALYSLLHPGFLCLLTIYTPEMHSLLPLLHRLEGLFLLTIYNHEMHRILSLLHYLEGLHALMNYSLQKLPPILVTPSGISILFNELHSLNAPPLILVTPSGRLILLSELQ